MQTKAAFIFPVGRRTNYSTRASSIFTFIEYVTAAAGLNPRPSGHRPSTIAAPDTISRIGIGNGCFHGIILNISFHSKWRKGKFVHDGLLHDGSLLQTMEWASACLSAELFWTSKATHRQHRFLYASSASKQWEVVTNSPQPWLRRVRLARLHEARDEWARYHHPQ